MLRQFSAKRIVLTSAVDWLGTLFALLLAAWVLARHIELLPPIRGALAAYEIPHRLAWYPSLLASPVFHMVALIWPFFLVLMGAYDGSRNATLEAELLNVFLAVSISTLTLASTLFFTFRTTSRLLFVIFFCLSVAALIDVRVTLWVYRLWLRPQTHLSWRQLLVDPTDVPQIAAAIGRVLTDLDLQRRLREAGPRRAAQFSWSRSAGQLSQLSNLKRPARLLPVDL